MTTHTINQAHKGIPMSIMEIPSQEVNLENPCAVGNDGEEPTFALASSEID